MHDPHVDYFAPGRLRQVGRWATTLAMRTAGAAGAAALALVGDTAIIGVDVATLDAMYVAGAGVMVPEATRVAAKLANVRQARLP